MLTKLISFNIILLGNIYDDYGNSKYIYFYLYIYLLIY